MGSRFNLSCCECTYYLSCYSCCALNGFPFQCEYSRLAWSSWDTRDVYVSTNMVGYHSRADGKVYGRATAYSYPLVFLPFISSAFVPTETMPKIVRVFAENQPVTSIVNAVRALYMKELLETIFGLRSLGA